MNHFSDKFQQTKYKPYPKYKDSGVEWLGEIPEHWGISKAGYLTVCLDGKRIPLNGEERSHRKGNIPYWGANGIVDYIDEYLFDEEVVLVGEDGAPFFEKYKNVSFVVNGKIWVNNHAHILRTSSKLDSRFLSYSFNQTDWYLYITGSTRDKLTQSDMNRVLLRFPPLQEQQTIANFLDNATAKIDTLIQKQERLIELLKEKRQALISHTVTKGLNPDVKMKDSGVEWLGEIPEHWNLSKLRFNFSFAKGLTITKANLKDEGIPCVNYGEIHSKYGFEVSAQKDKLKCVDEEYLNSSKISLLSEGDFIFADTSEDIEGAGNFTHLIGESQVFAGYHTVIARQSNEEHNFRFFAYLFDSIAFRTQIRLAVKGVKVFSITQFILKDSIIWFPDAPEQKQIAQYLDEKTSKIDTLTNKATKAIELLKERRTALISAVVTGKIDVREFNE